MVEEWLINLVTQYQLVYTLWLVISGFLGYYTASRTVLGFMLGAGLGAIIFMWLNSWVISNLVV